MAVAEMSVMSLVGLEKDRSAILDALQKCGAAQIREVSDHDVINDDGTSTSLLDRESEVSVGNISVGIDRADSAVRIIVSAADELPEKSRPKIEKDGFGVAKEEFFAIEQKEGRLDEVMTDLETAAERRTKIKAEKATAAAEIRAYEPYLCLKEKFDFYHDTKCVFVAVGVIGNDKVTVFLQKSADNGFIAEVLGSERGVSTVALAAHRSVKKDAESLLSQAGFIKLQFGGDVGAQEKIDQLKSKIAALDEEDGKLHEKILAHAGDVKDLKLYSDYLSFLKEKEEAGLLLGNTHSAFLLEAYVPTESTAAVKSAVEEVASASFITFEVVPRDQFAPTLNKNGKVVGNFEVVTNMYSSPAYGALDPNAVMSFFFSLFMGVIMADVGYGVLMAVGGFIFAKTRREGTSINRMAKVFAIGGFFAIIFGAVFDSWLGFPLLRQTLGEEYNAFYAAHLDQIISMTSVMGVSVPAILMWCLGLGTAQMGVGLVLKAVQSFGRGRVLEGIFGGLVWAIALFSLIFWVYGLCTGLETLSTYAMYVLVGSVAVGVLTAGIGEKGLGIFTKTFSSAYGLINYVSDILSYARLYGLMLSGAQIASIFTNTLAIGMLFPQGIVGVIFGVILIIVGNVFNLAINLLGAYIHDARLQYVEFFGKFYEGEGELFTPFGNRPKHVYFKG